MALQISTVDGDKRVQHAVAPSAPAMPWELVVQRVEQQISRAASGPVHTKVQTPVSTRDLGELLRLQTELHRCQVKIELLSKVSESANATFRKLEQGQ